eukprot:13614099-Ditylum_brightwellii.AAC.1
MQIPGHTEDCVNDDSLEEDNNRCHQDNDPIPLFTAPHMSHSVLKICIKDLQKVLPLLLQSTT